MSDLVVNVCSKGRSHNELNIEYTSKNMILQTSSEVSSRPVLDKNILKKKIPLFSLQCLFVSL